MGIVLYEMVTHQVPYRAETPLAVILKHVQAPLPLPSSVAPEIHPAVERVLLKALAKRREDRYPAMEAFVEGWRQAMDVVRAEPESVVSMLPDPDLVAATQTALTVSPETLPQPPAVEPAAPTTTRQRISSRLIGVGVIGLVAILALVAFWTVRNLGNQYGDGGVVNGNGDIDTDSNDAQVITNPDLSGRFAPAFNPEGEWSTFSAANAIMDLAVQEEAVYAATLGGLVQWLPARDEYRIMTMADGLPDQHLSAVFIDEDGATWVGSDGAGVAHLVGDEWVIYDEDDGLDSNYIRDITRVGDFIVVATYYGGPDGGVNLFNGERWTQLPDFPSSEDPADLHYNVTTLASQGEDVLWIGTENGLARFNGDSFETFTSDEGLPDNVITSLYVDQANAALIVGTDSGAAILSEEGVQVLDPMRDVSIWGIAKSSADDYWFIGYSTLARFNRITADWLIEDEQVGDLPPYASLTTLTSDDAGNVYIGAYEGGIVRYDDSYTTYTVPNVPRQAETGHILAAPSGELWFMELYGELIDVYIPEAAQWELGPDLPYVPLAFDNEGKVWGGGGEGLWVESASGTVNTTSEDGLPSDEIRLVAFRGNGEVWVGTGAGVAILSPDLAVVNRLTAESAGFASNVIRDIIFTGAGEVWVATDEGVSRQSAAGEWTHYGIGDPFTGEFQFVSAIAEAADESIWLATFGDSAYRFVDGRWQHFRAGGVGVRLPSPYLNDLSIAPDGALWFGAEGGAARFDGETWDYLGAEVGLLGWNVFAIHPAKNGVLWFGTDGGIYRYAPP